MTIISCNKSTFYLLIGYLTNYYFYQLLDLMTLINPHNTKLLYSKKLKPYIHLMPGVVACLEFSIEFQSNNLIY